MSETQKYGICLDSFASALTPSGPEKGKHCPKKGDDDNIAGHTEGPVSLYSCSTVLQKQLVQDHCLRSQTDTIPTTHPIPIPQP